MLIYEVLFVTDHTAISDDLNLKLGLEFDLLSERILFFLCSCSI